MTFENLKFQMHSALTEVAASRRGKLWLPVAFFSEMTGFFQRTERVQGCLWNISTKVLALNGAPSKLLVIVVSKGEASDGLTGPGPSGPKVHEPTGPWPKGPKARAHGPSTNGRPKMDMTRPF